MVFIGNEKEETERSYIQELLAYKIEGMIIMSHTIPSGELAKLPIPIVTIEREDQYVCSVNTDNYMGGYQAAGLLAKHHCDILIHINSPYNEAIPANGRIRGFTDFCTEHDLRNELLLREFGHTHEEAREQLIDILEQLETAYAGQKKGIFISSDTLANIESEETTLEPLEGTEWSAIPSETSPAVPIWAGNQTAAEQGELLLPTEDPQGVILPESSIRLLTEIDLNDLTKEELRLARNEIYARHGRKFNDSTLQSYFDSKIWYRGSISPDQFDDMALLSNLERKNLDIIKEKEASMN